MTDLMIMEVGVQNLGVQSRVKDINDFSFIPPSLANTNNILEPISLDENGEYTFVASEIFSPSGALYDNEIKVLEWRRTIDGCLVVEIYTTKQVNLFTNVKVKECLVSAKGPLFIQGQIEADTVGIQAEALGVSGSLQSNSSVILTAKQGIGLLAPINAENLSIHAAYVHQGADLHLNGHLDVSTQCFKQEPSVRTRINTLRLIAEQCELSGNFLVSNESFIVAKAWICGDNQSQSTLQFSAANYIRARNLQIRGDTEVCIGHPNRDDRSIFIINETMAVDKLAVMDFHHVNSFANELDNHGEFSLHRSMVEIKTLKQNGLFETERSLVKVVTHLDHRQASSVLKNSRLVSFKTSCEGGLFSLDQCEFQGDSFSSYVGSFDFEVKNKTKVEVNALKLSEKTVASWVDASVKVNGMMFSAATLNLEAVGLIADKIKSIRNKSTIHNSSVRAQTQIELCDAVELSNISLYGKNILLNGHLAIQKTKMSAQFLNIASAQAEVNSLILFSNRLNIRGSKEPDRVVIKNSELSIQLFSSQNCVTFYSSAILGVSKELFRYDLTRLKLIDCKFITKNAVCQAIDSELNLEHFSTFQVGLLHSQGAMKAKDSQVSCTFLWQDKANWKSESSTIEVQGTIISQTSTMELKKSAFQASLMRFQDTEFNLQEGSQLDAGTVMTNSHTILASNQSKLLAGKFLLRGRTEICESLLAAEELRIYDEFRAIDQSIVSVDDLITVAKDAHAEFTYSKVNTSKVQTFGEVVVSDTVVRANTQVAVWSSGTCTLEGDALVSTENMVIRGDLVTQMATVPRLKPEEKIDEEENAPAPTLHVTGKLHLTRNASIEGTADLKIEAKEFLHAGSTHIDGELKARGEIFSNHGTLEADAIYLGFDDKILNFGSFYTNSMLVHSNFLNLGGFVSAKRSLSIAGFYGINLGLIAANSYSNSTLLSINGGLVLPNLAADWGDILSWRNLAALAKITATTLVPTYAHTINMLAMAPSLYNGARGLYHLANNFNWNARSHQWMAQMCQLKDIAFSAWNAFNVGQAIPGELAHLSSDFPAFTSLLFDVNTYSYANFKTAASKFDWQHFGFRAAGAFLGNYSESALLGVNYGVALAPSIMQKNACTVNLGVEASLNYNAETPFFYNGGWIDSNEFRVTTDYSYNTGYLEGINQFTFEAKQMVNRGEVDGKHVHITIGNLAQYGHFALEKGQVKIAEFSDNAEADTKYSWIVASGDNFNSNGHLEADHTQFTYTNRFQTTETASEQFEHVWVKAKEFIHGGALDYQQFVTIEADTAILKKDSVIQGKKTAEEELFVPKKDEKAESETELSEKPPTDSESKEKEFKPQHVLVFKTNKEVVDGRLAGGDYTFFRGMPVETETIATDNKENDSSDQKEEKPTKSKELIFGEHASTDLTYGSVLTESLINEGDEKFTKFQFDVDNLSQQQKLVLEDCGGEITHFDDARAESTTINDSWLTGDQFYTESNFASTKSHFVYRNQFVIEEKAQVKTAEQVKVITGHFENKGQVAYEGILTVEADSALLASGSAIVGKKTAKEELFVPQEGSTEKEFKPQHAFLLQANTEQLHGKIAGGDYTLIAGKPAKEEESTDSSPGAVKKSESLEIGQSAEIDIAQATIASKSVHNSGNVHLENSSLEIDHTSLDGGGQLALVDGSWFTGDTLDTQDGTFNLDGSVVKLAHTHFGSMSREQFKDSILKSTEFRDESLMTYQGRVDILTDQYTHLGRVSKGNADDQNLFHVKAQTANLWGSADLDTGVFEIAHFADSANFISGLGQYSNYLASKEMMVETQDFVTLTNPIYRTCDVTVKASGITMMTDDYLPRDLSLISTAGDVYLLGNVANNNLYVQSAGNIWNNHVLYNNGVGQFVAAGGFYNLGGVINADTVNIKAGEIKNVTSGSYAASAPWPISVGEVGAICGRNEAYLEATNGNIENYGGFIGSGNYTQLIASGNVVNACNIGFHFGPYDIIYDFNGGVIAGGSGLGKDGGVGLYVKAGGKIISDASDFISNGTNYLEADSGFDFSARQQTYVSDVSTTSTWYGKETTHIATSTTVKGANVISGTGVNILRTQYGGVNAVAAQFISPGGTQIYAQNDVQLYNLKSQNRVYDSTSKLWGLSKYSRSEIYESSTPTVFMDNGSTRIFSSEGSIEAYGTLFIGGGDLELDARKRLKFRSDILQHEVEEKTRGLSISVPGMGAWQSWKSGGHWWDMAAAEDPTLSKFNSLFHSNNPAEAFANSANLGINLYNTADSMMRGFAQDTLGDELLSRYRLGGKNGFSPSVTLSLTESSTTTRFQTVADSGINRGGNVHLKAGEGITLENGVKIHAGSNMDINAPEIIAKAAELRSSIDQKTSTQSVTLLPAEILTHPIQDVSLGYSHTVTELTNTANAELSANGNMHLHYQEGAVHRVELDGARIDAGTLDAQIEHLKIIDKQDKSFTRTKAGSVSLLGQISAYQGEGDAAITKQHSGIHVVDGINTNGHVVEVESASMKGGEIVTEGENHIHIDRLIAENVRDYQAYNGGGVSLNVNDLQRLAGQKPTNEVGEQAIATLSIGVDHVDYQANNQSVVHGAQGTQAEIVELTGNIHTESADGKTVFKNKEVSLTLDVPLTNTDYLQKSQNNIKNGMQRFSTKSDENHLPNEPPIPEPVEQILPSRRNEEEEEEEEEQGEPREKPHELELESPANKSINTSNPSELDPEAFKAALALYMASDDQNLLENTPSAAPSPGEKDTKADQYNSIQLRLKNAILKAIKAGAEDGWSRLGKQFDKETVHKLIRLSSESGVESKLVMKTYFGTKGLLITIMFNLGSASLEGKKKILQDAALSTGGDIVFGLVLKYGARSAAGPVGWGVVALDAIDTLVYDQNYVDKLCEESIHHLNESQQLLHQGNYLGAYGMQQLTAAQTELAGRAQAFHALKEFLTEVPKEIVKLPSKIAESVRKEGLNTQKSPLLPTESRGSALDRNRFFGKTQQKEEDKIEKEHTTVLGAS